MSRRSATPEELYDKVVKVLLRNPDVSRSKKKGFGSTALWTHGKIFVMLSSKRQFVAKLPRERVDELINSGIGERWDPGHGRVMKEWLAVGPNADEKWLDLAKEAMKFVASRD